jgi:hypothetical protein
MFLSSNISFKWVNKGDYISLAVFRDLIPMQNCLKITIEWNVLALISGYLG